MTDTTITVHKAITAVLGKLPAIGKNQRNKAQGFSYRGVDDVLNNINPLLAEHGVYFTPDVIERIAEERATKSGSVLYTVHLHVRYRIFGPAGDFVEASTWGEGTDTGDKATNKAMTAAMKYMLFQVFAISDEEMEDSDASAPEPAPKRTRSARAADVDAGNASRAHDEGDRPGPTPADGPAATPAPSDVPTNLLGEDEAVLEGWVSKAQQDTAHASVVRKLRGLPAHLKAEHKAWDGKKGHPKPIPLGDWKKWSAYVNALVGVAELQGEPTGEAA